MCLTNLKPPIPNPNPFHLPTNLITLLRNLGLASILPLDNNIYFHKLVGRIIFAQAWLHTIMHLINFGQHVFIEIYQNSFVRTLKAR